FMKHKQQRQSNVLPQLLDVDHSSSPFSVVELVESVEELLSIVHVDDLDFFSGC
ncbi:hypothetical protein Dimus_000901, partial [Dionaea muscipula]